jgi:hypothetical protein
MGSNRVGCVGHVLAGQAGREVCRREALVRGAITDVMANTPSRTHRLSMRDRKAIERRISAK